MGASRSESNGGPVIARVALVLSAAFAVGCGAAISEEPGPIRVRLSWAAPIDLDLLVDEQPAHRDGGSPDRQSGGSEEYEIPPGRGTYTIAVQNLSGHAASDVVVTVERARETEPLTFGAIVKTNAREDRWIVCEIDAEKGSVTPIGQWE